MSNRQLKLKVLKDEALTNKEKSNQSSAKDKRLRCGQCEKGLAFTVSLFVSDKKLKFFPKIIFFIFKHCLECCEDYCANCFTDFHMKGALQKHRTQPILQDSARSAHTNKYNIYDANLLRWNLNFFYIFIFLCNN